MYLHVLVRTCTCAIVRIRVTCAHAYADVRLHVYTPALVLVIGKSPTCVGDFLKAALQAVYAPVDLLIGPVEVMDALSSAWH
jgi:hypothetical protein